MIERERARRRLLAATGVGVALGLMALGTTASAAVDGALSYSSCISANATPGCAAGADMAQLGTLAMTPDGANVYAPSYYSNTIDGFGRSSSTGALQALTGSAASVVFPASGVRPPYAVAVSPDGTSAYGVGFGFSGGWKGVVVSYSRDVATGALTQIGCLASDNTLQGCTQVGLTQRGTWGGLRSVVVSPDGADVYVGAGDMGAILQYRRNAGTGALTQNGCIMDVGAGAACGATAPALFGAQALATSPDGQNLYAALWSSSGVAVLDRNASTGVLTAAAGTTACIVNSATTGCTTSSNGAAADAPGAGALSYPWGIGVSPDGANVYVGGQDSYLAEFTRNPNTGALTDLACLHDTTATARCPAAPGAFKVGSFAMTAASRMVYTGSTEGVYVAAFSRQAGTGQLEQLPGRAGCMTYLLSDSCATVLQMDGGRLLVSPDDAFVYVGGYANIAAFGRVTVAPLTVGVAGSGSGRVVAPLDDIDCAATCTTQMATGSSVTLRAVADAGSAFTGWTGACSGTSTTCTLAIARAASATAAFAPASSMSSTTTTPTAAAEPASTSTPGPPLLAVRSVTASRTGVAVRATAGAPGTVAVRVTGPAASHAVGTGSVCAATKRVAKAGSVTVSCAYTSRLRRLMSGGPVRLMVATSLTTSAGARARQSTTFTTTERGRRVAPVTG